MKSTVKSLLAWSDSTIKLVEVAMDESPNHALDVLLDDLGAPHDHLGWQSFNVTPGEMAESTLAGFVHKSAHDELSFDAENWTNRFKLADQLIFNLLAVMAPPGEEVSDTERAIRSVMDDYRQRRIDQEAIIKRQAEERKESK